MNHSFNKNDIFDFVHGRMDEARRRRMLEAMEQDEWLKNEVETMEATQQLMGYLQQEAMLDELDQWRDEEIRQLRRRSAHRKRWFIFGGVLAVLLFAVYLFYRNTAATPSQAPLPNTEPAATEAPATEKTDDTAREEVKAPAPAPSARPMASKYMDALASAIASNKRAVGAGDTSLQERSLQLFQEKQFAAVAALEGGNAEVVFIKAVSNFRLKRYEQAAALFRSIQQDFSRGYDAEWGEALCLSAQLPGACARLKKLLQAIQSNENQLHRSKVKALMEDIQLQQTCN